MFPELLEEGLEPFDVPGLWLSTMEPDTYMDISETIDVKIEALKRHQSQGADESEPFVRQRAQETGAAGGLEFAEGFKVFTFIEEKDEG
jgi:LmbE family N-acetylglucosaminyl deacetylase